MFNNNSNSFIYNLFIDKVEITMAIFYITSNHILNHLSLSNTYKMDNNTVQKIIHSFNCNKRKYRLFYFL